MTAVAIYKAGQHRSGMHSTQHVRMGPFYKSSHHHAVLALQRNKLKKKEKTIRARMKNHDNNNI